MQLPTKRSSDEATRELSESIKKATQEAVREFHEMKSKNKSRKARLQKGSLKEIIVLAKKKILCSGLDHYKYPYCETKTEKRQK